MRIVFNYLLLATCVLLLRVDAPGDSVDCDHSAVQATHDDSVDLAPSGLAPRLPVEEEVELEQDGLHEIPHLCYRIKSFDFRVKFTELGHRRSCSRAALAGHPHLRI